MSPQTEKLQKVLAAHALGSRRLMEKWIAQGRVTVNGQVASVGCRVDTRAVIAVDKKNLVSLTSKPCIEMLMYHKPRGEVCTQKDPENRSTVFDILPPPNSGRWVMVGRLDINTSGLLLFTNNGEWANQLMHPRFHLEREYKVRVYGEITQEKLAKLKLGVVLEDGKANFDKIKLLNPDDNRNHWLSVTISQGRNRIVRRLMESQDLRVNRLSRVRFGCLKLPEHLKMGEFMKVSEREIQRLRLSS